MSQHPLQMASVHDQRPVATGSALEVDDPVFRSCPHPRLDELRAREPVHHDRELDRVVLTRAADVAAALADRTLSSDPFKARATSYARRRLTGGERGNNMPMVFLDDPDHSRLRRLVSQAFTALAIEARRPRVEALATGLLDAIDPTQPFDLVAAYAGPLPTLVIAAMLGVDEARVGQFKQWSDDFLAIFSSKRSEGDRQRLGAAVSGINGCLADEVAKRRERSRDDLIGRLVAAEEQGNTLTETEIVNTCRMLLVAGNVTTTDLIGNGAVALLRHPEQLARLSVEPALWPAAVEEVLRFDSSVAAWNRQALDERQIDGCRVEAGQTITAMLLAANHDPALHASPHQFDIGRDHQQHHSFGGGAHFCLGASLARLESQVGLATLFDRFPHLRLVLDQPLQRKTHPGFNGYEAVWVSATDGTV